MYSRTSLVTTPRPLALEAVFDAAKDADFWLNVGFASDLDSLLAMDTRYAEFKAFAQGQRV